MHGTTNLRVVDASVIPIELGCHIQSTVYAIAEKVPPFRPSIIKTLINLFRLLIS